MKKIRYLCMYRGTREADLLLGNFVAWYLTSEVSKDRLEALERLLEQDDESVFSALRNPPENHLLLPLKALAEAFQAWQRDQWRAHD